MYVAVFAGGALGSFLRELLLGQELSVWPLSSSLVVNVIACFAIGWLYAIRHKLHQHVIHLLAVGFCGGLSTFSTFAADISVYLTSGEISTAVASASLEILVGLLAVVMGERFGHLLLARPG